VNTMGKPGIKHFQVGPGDAVIMATDGSGNTASVICPVPPKHGDDDDHDRDSHKKKEQEKEKGKGKGKK